MMLIIIDANCANLALGSAPSPDFAPVLNSLLSGKRRLIVGGTKLKSEYTRLTEVWRFIKALDQAGRAFLVNDAQVDAEQVNVEQTLILVSDDPHIIALARHSGARLLCSKDQALHQDFCNPKLIAKPRGKVYQNASHAHLLTRS